MSVSSNITIWCDTPQCHKHFIASSWASAQKARVEAKKLGWSRRKGEGDDSQMKDICEHCTKYPPSTQKE